MNYIEYKKKKYEIEEPTIEEWSEIMSLKNMLTEQELFVRMISKVLNISQEDVMNEDAMVINKVGIGLFSVFNKSSKELKSKIELNGVTYKFVDVNKISFGQFVDIDTFLKKDENYRISNLNELAAYLYCEEGIEYGQSDFQQRIEAMKQLPISTMEGSVFFLTNLGRVSYQLMNFYSTQPLKYQMMRLQVALMSFGGGIKRLVPWPKTGFGKLIGLLLSPLLLVLIICLTLWTTTKNKIKSLLTK